MQSRLRLRVWLGAVAAALLTSAGANAQGIYLPGGGAAHISMGGASTATPIDAIGALYWNPAAIGRLGHSEAEIGGAFLFPNFYLDSATPLGLRTGRTKSDSGTGIASSIGVVQQLDDTPWTFGVGLATLGGGSVNFPGDVNNPVLVGIGPLGNVQGPIAASTAFLQITPTAAYKVTDRLVLGLGPTVDVALTSFDPAFFGSPDDSNRDGVGTFPTATHSRPFWGGGLRAGLVYSVTDRLDVGFGYTSPQWFEPWVYHARTEIGLPRTLSLNASLPAIYSWGIGYRATDRLLLAADLRYIDYRNTDLFGTRVPAGGLGWNSVFVAALGTRYQLTDRMSVSGGYVYNDNPIPSTGTLFNVQGPTITRHTVTVGTTMSLTDAISASVGYAYGFQNSITGPVREATGFGVKLSSSVHLLTFALQIKFGGGRWRKPVPCADRSGSPSADATPSSPTAAGGPNRAPNLAGPPPGG